MNKDFALFSFCLGIFFCNEQSHLIYLAVIPSTPFFLTCPLRAPAAACT